MPSSGLGILASLAALVSERQTGKPLGERCLMSPEDLQSFLHGALTSNRKVGDLPRAPSNGTSDWAAFLQQRLGLIPVRTSTQAAGLRSYPLWIARHSTSGPVLIKHVPSLLSWERVQCLELNTGRTFDLMPENEGDLEDIFVLIEPYNVNQSMTRRRLAEFILGPVRGLMRIAVVHHAVAALCGSVLFIVNFNLLSYAVPAQNMNNFWATAWLIAATGIVLFLSLYSAQRVQFRLDSIMEERAEILKLSVLWSLRPQYLAVRGAAQAEQLCLMIAQAGKAASQALFAGITILAVLPVIFFMYLRLSTFLFVTSLVLVMIAAILQLLLQWKSHIQQRRISLHDAEADSYLYRILHGVMRLKFYGTIKHELDRWEDRHADNLRSRLRLTNSASIRQEIGALASDCAQLITFFILSVVIAKSSDQAPAMTVATAFITLHLVNQVHRVVPRTMNALAMMGTIRIDLSEADDLLEESEKIRALSTPSVTRATASVECHRLRLPHGCRFKGEESLTVRLDGPKVVQIRGDSGAGKTTFLNSVLGLLEPEGGSVEIFGVDPTRLSQYERRRIFSYLDQNVQLLPGTVRDNLKLFSLESAGDRNLWEALDRVMLLDRVRALPLGLDTPIADARRNFSTGERQRMALAQCIAKQSSILILDEAMSGLPKDMEQAIFRNIQPLFEQIYFVSHREHMNCFAETTIELEARR